MTVYRSIQDYFPGGQVDMPQFWKVARKLGTAPRATRRPAYVLWIRFNEDGSIRQPYREVGRRLKCSNVQAHTLVNRALRRLSEPALMSQFWQPPGEQLRGLCRLLCSAPMHGWMGDPELLEREIIRIYLELQEVKREETKT